VFVRDELEGLASRPEPIYDALMSKKREKTDALAALQTRAAAAAVEYETVAKDKTLRRVKNDALTVARGFVALATGAFDEALVEKEALVAAATRIEAAVMARVWGAAYLIHGGCSDDGFADFRAGLIALGRTRYEDAVAKPDSLAAIPAVETLTLFEGFQYGPREVISEREIVAKLERHRTDRPAGRAWKDDAELAARFPRLWKRFG
jgi:hypothetical protein